jgi:hypothetical protein
MVSTLSEIIDRKKLIDEMVKVGFKDALIQLMLFTADAGNIWVGSKYHYDVSHNEDSYNVGITTVLDLSTAEGSVFKHQRQIMGI